MISHIGAHIPLLSNVSECFATCKELSIHTIQTFTSSPMKSNTDHTIVEEKLTTYQMHQLAYPLNVYIHASYLLNIANKDDLDKYNHSMTLLKAELSRSQLLHAHGITIHPGSNKNKKEGYLILAESIENVYKNNTYHTPLFLEPSAGQGNTLPSMLEECKIIYDLLSPNTKKKVGFTLDTCHLFSAGYDFHHADAVENLVKEIASTITFDTLHLLHINNSKFNVGAKKDRHDNIDKGLIPLSFFKNIMNHETLKTKAKILETPVKHALDFKREIDLLYQMIDY